ncbi:MAG: hypothetical protein NVS3B12_03540 [Acidimicrobiales bacterium]
MITSDGLALLIGMLSAGPVTKESSAGDCGAQSPAGAGHAVIRQERHPLMECRAGQRVQVVERAFDHGHKPILTPFTGNEEADRAPLDNGLALLTGMLLDQPLR